jgi:hypothetical protein
MRCKDHTGNVFKRFGPQTRSMRVASLPPGSPNDMRDGSLRAFALCFVNFFPVTPFLTSFFLHIHQKLPGTYIAHSGVVFLPDQGSECGRRVKWVIKIKCHAPLDAFSALI